MKNKNPQRVLPFRPDAKRAKKSSVTVRARIHQVMDADGQIYVGDWYRYRTDKLGEVVVEIQKFNNAGQAITVRAVKDDGDYMGKPYRLDPETIGCHWMVAADGLTAQIDNSNAARQMRKRDQAEAIARCRAAKGELTAQSTTEDIRRAGEKHGVDFNYLRGYRDALICRQVHHHSTDRELVEIGDQCEITVDRLKRIRVRKAVTAWRHPFD